MRTEGLDYDLPGGLIAQQPTPVRSDSRLLVIRRDTGGFFDSRFDRIGEFLQPGDCLVLNDTKVLPARFFAKRTSGANLEGLFLEQKPSGLWEIMLKGSRKVKVGESIRLKDIKGQDFCCAAVIEKTSEGKCLLKADSAKDARQILGRIGFAPLPPYIKRNADIQQAGKDKIRYQTVYAKNTGAIAAPTAGLHFTKGLIEKLKNKGICFAYVTLHVGEGTFKPVTAKMLEQHDIHEEQFSIDEKNARLINRTKENGGRIIAVGTTSVRTLEAALAGSKIEPTCGQTKLFITPGYKFKMVDCLVTNFHLPKSTLLALVAAFAGLDRILAAYRYAIEQRYRFYSYGDAMLII
jgi:S-adenosylmethionine:tRNA ribosyltransferase-isomerase